MNFDYTPTVTTMSPYGNVDQYSFNTPPAANEILNENIARIAGTQILPLTLENTQQILQNPDAGFDYFIVKVPKERTNPLKNLALYDLPRDVMDIIALYLNVRDIKSLGRAAKSSKDYASFIHTIFNVYCFKRKTRIFPTDTGTIICSGGAEERVYFTGYDEYGIADPEGRLSFIDLVQISSLGNRTVKSIVQYPVANGNKHHSSSIFLLTEEGEVFMLNKAVCEPFEKTRLQSPVLEIACYTNSLYFRTKHALYTYERDFYSGPHWKTQILNIPDLKKIEEFAIVHKSILAVKYKDGTAKVFDIRHVQNIQHHENNLCSINRLWKARHSKSLYISTNDKFFKIEASARLFEYESLRGHKVIELFEGGKLVLTEGGSLWKRNRGFYHQILPQYNISHGFATSESGILFLTQGKLHYVGSDDYRTLINNSPEDEYLVPTEVKQFNLSPKKIWGNPGHIWFSEDQRFIHLIAEKTGYGKPLKFTFINYGSQPRLDYNCMMLSAWNRVCPEYNFIRSMMNYTELHIIVRRIITSSTSPNELIQLLQEERSKIDSVVANSEEVLKFMELLNSPEFN